MTEAVPGLRVHRAGPLALLQDAGRFGVRRLGVTQGGPADLHGWAWANHLVSNGWGAPVLEVTFGGLDLVAERDLTLAVAGADLAASVEGVSLPPGEAFILRAGQRLSFDSPHNGLRAYLAVSGGFRAPEVMGSVACVVREGLGGHDGRGSRLATGDVLQVAMSSARPSQGRSPHAYQAIDYSAPARLALLPGAQIDEFAGTSLFAAFHADWRVDERADRMGVRLTGPVLRCRLTTMVSEGIALGAVQVPPDGQPIVLLNDRQTIGGYPRLGALTPLAASRLAQCLPGQRVRLQAISRERALANYRSFRSDFS